MVQTQAYNSEQLFRTHSIIAGQSIDSIVETISSHVPTVISSQSFDNGHVRYSHGSYLVERFVFVVSIFLSIRDNVEQSPMKRLSPIGHERTTLRGNHLFDQ
jgi:hypothetical protein